MANKPAIFTGAAVVSVPDASGAMIDFTLDGGLLHKILTFGGPSFSVMCTCKSLFRYMAAFFWDYADNSQNAENLMETAKFVSEALDGLTDNGKIWIFNNKNIPNNVDYDESRMAKEVSASFPYDEVEPIAEIYNEEVYDGFHSGYFIGKFSAHDMWTLVRFVELSETHFFPLEIWEFNENTIFYYTKSPDLKRGSPADAPDDFLEFAQFWRKNSQKKAKIAHYLAESPHFSDDIPESIECKSLGFGYQYKVDVCNVGDPEGIFGLGISLLGLPTYQKTVFKRK